MSAFNRRIEPKEYMGFSAQAVIYGAAGIVILFMSAFIYFVVKDVSKIVYMAILWPTAGACLVWAAYNAIHHKNALLLKAMRLSSREGRCHTKETLNPL